MIFFSREFITLLLGEKFLVTVPAFKILAVVWGLMFISTLLLRILTAIDHQELVPLCMGCTLIINIVLDLILIPQKGFVGAAIATLFAEMGLITISFFFVSKHVNYFSLWKIFYGPCCGVFFMSVFCLWLKNMNFMSKILFILPLSLFIYFIYLILTKTITSKEYQWVSEFMRSVRGEGLKRKFESNFNH